MYGEVDVVTSPIAYVRKTPWVFGKSLSVRYLQFAGGVWVEIIVHMNSLYVVAADDVLYDSTNPFACDVQTRVEVPLFVVLPESLGMFAEDVIRAYHRSVRFSEVDSIGIEPDVDFHVAFMRLVDRPCQRVITFTIWTFTIYHLDISVPDTLFAGEPMGDGLVIAAVKCVGGRADLEDDGVDADGVQRVEQKYHLLLLFFRVSHGFL